MRQLPYRSTQHILLLIVVAVLTFVLIGRAFPLQHQSGRSALLEWVRTAPLEPETVAEGDTGWSLLKERLPEEARLSAHKGELLSELKARTGESLGNINPPKAVQLPIPYEEWEAQQQ
jgi:hypothetical protein